MALIKQLYTDRETVITAENMNDIQDAIIALEDGLLTVEDDRSGAVVTMTDAAKRGFRSFNIYGRTTQNGTPTPDAPVELESAGDIGRITLSVTGENDAQSMTIYTPNGLPGIPVTSGGNYTDANGQQWICDEIDLARGVYVQRVCKKTFHGNSDERWKVYSYPEYDGYQYTAEDMSVGYLQNGYCDIFEIQTKSAPRLGVWLGVNTNVIYVHHAVSIAADLASWNAWLSENPMTVIYFLATPIETPLSKDELAAYAKLHTYKNSTTVSNNALAHMELEYVVDSKKYFDSLVSGGSIIPATVE